MCEDDMLVGEDLVDIIEDIGREYTYRFLFELKSKVRPASISLDIEEECHDKKSLFFSGTISSKGILGDDLADFLLNCDYLDYKIGFIVEEESRVHVVLREPVEFIIDKRAKVVYLECSNDCR